MAEAEHPLLQLLQRPWPGLCCPCRERQRCRQLPARATLVALVAAAGGTGTGGIQHWDVPRGVPRAAGGRRGASRGDKFWVEVV